ncbi:precorrin-6Y C5,15-methyltransferase (decarboxylating) [Haloechinothrix alba]|uniref:Precorrin-6Y C5,15-methyltransferase (Decarboxylating) n=1 Tax=Haloechinothrix alba TaxID=664784 RepID=A0A238WPY0_9PSEU|nr:precorrin-6y C5,15-methyltransferase (decarboxylating) subunit CbiE [Haloechinothrix alba]SNR48602.1 precorrin-6Y C5,15-methyltransferase (decarboxylating) [Haloechinothrix alba]
MPPANHPTNDVLTVVGIGADGWPGLADGARDEIGACDVLFGGRRQLELVPASVPATRVEWPSPLLPALDGLLAEHAERRRCVLASGDPLLSGIATTLITRYGQASVRVVPALSSVTLARARLGWSFEETEVISSVARSVDRVARALAPGRRLLVLSSTADTPGEVAGLLADRGYGPSTLTVLENLGADGERSYQGTARGWSHPPGSDLNVVAVECAADAGTVPHTTIAGLPDDAFEHDGQITKRDLRAAALARLAPLPGQLLWDIGAGAGSVAVEWCRVHPSNRALAVERDPTRAARIGRNAHLLGVPDLRVVTDAAPDGLPADERPDAIFLGGAVSAPGMVPACVDALAPGGRLVAHAVTVEAESALLAAYRDYGGELLRIGAEHAAPLGGFTGWQPARTVTQYSLLVSEPGQDSSG